MESSDFPKRPREEAVIRPVTTVFGIACVKGAVRTRPTAEPIVQDVKGWGAHSRAPHQEILMKADRMTNPVAYAIAAALAIGPAAVYATDVTSQQAAAPVHVAQAGRIGSITVEASVDSTAVMPPMQAGVRKAASEGRTSLRRYVTRTQNIYNYNYWDYAKYLPAE